MFIDYLAVNIGSKWLTVITTCLSVCVGVLTAVTYFVKESEGAKKENEFIALQLANGKATEDVKRLTKKSNRLQEEKFDLLEEFHKKHIEDSKDIKDDILDVNAPRISIVFIGFEQGLFKFGIRNDDTRTFNKVFMQFRTDVELRKNNEVVLLEESIETIDSTSTLGKPFLPGHTFLSRSRLYNVAEDDALWKVADEVRFTTNVFFGLDEYRSVNSQPERSIFYKVFISKDEISRPKTINTTNRPKFKLLNY